LKVARLTLVGGNWNGSYDYLYFETTPAGRYLYGLVSKDSTARVGNATSWDVEYDPSDGKFYDIGSESPFQWGPDNTGTNLSAFPTSSNIQTHYWYHNSGSLECYFTNPYYVAPPEPVVEPVERLVATGDWENNF